MFTKIPVFKGLTDDLTFKYVFSKNKYSEAKKVININLIKGNFRRVNNSLIYCYKFKNDVTNKVIDTGNVEMYLIRLDKVDCINYNLIEKRLSDG